MRDVESGDRNAGSGRGEVAQDAPSELSGPSRTGTPDQVGATEDEFGWPDFDDSDTVAVAGVSSTTGSAEPDSAQPAFRRERSEDEANHGGAARQPDEPERSHQPAAG